MNLEILIPRFCRADLGEFLFDPANSGKFLANFSANFSSANFLAVFLQGFRPLEKVTPKIHAQIVGIPLQVHFLEPKHFSRRFLLPGEIKNDFVVCCFPHLPVVNKFPCF